MKGRKREKAVKSSKEEGEENRGDYRRGIRKEKKERLNIINTNGGKRREMYKD